MKCLKEFIDFYIMSTYIISIFDDAQVLECVVVDTSKFRMSDNNTGMNCEGS